MDKDSSLIYLFEAIDRVIRFLMHIQDVRSQFYDYDDNQAKTSLVYIKSYEDAVDKLLNILVLLYDKICGESFQEESAYRTIEGIIKTIGLLHNELHYLPRPSEPIELKRFGRIINKSIIGFNDYKVGDELAEKPSYPIYLSESISESAYLTDPIQEIKKYYINPLICQVNGEFGLSLDRCEFEYVESALFHLSIPRIDANNPIRWPSLIHEVAHKLMRNEYFKSGGIYEDFIELYDFSAREEMDTMMSNNGLTKEVVKKWLIECWCDLLGCIMMGPSFWFSQNSAFLFGRSTIEKKEGYPTPYFRLRLMNVILRHRFGEMISDDVVKVMNLSMSLSKAFELELQENLFNNSAYRNLFVFFRIFFLKHFFSVDGESGGFLDRRMNESIASIVRYKNLADGDAMNIARKKLAKGYPIPSIRVDGDVFKERPAQIQEILHIANIYRNTGMQEEVFNILREEISDVKTKLMAIFKRFDMSVLRSIQVSEWFDLYDSESKIGDMIYDESQQPEKGYGLLNDNYIYQKIKSDELVIIPIMNISDQLGSTSFDIRLGTSLQVYMHTKYGVVDFVSGDVLGNSRTLDLDYLESFTISPSQFVLGHSMEYIKLPVDMAAQVEGRSSFARLGLQVHMTAGFVDPGFEGVLTFEIYNAGHNPIKLYPGLRIGQLRFIQISEPMRPYNRNIDAKYGGLLVQHESKQFKDSEVGKIKEKINEYHFKCR